MNTTTLSRDIKATGIVSASECWSCGDATSRPDGLCKPCSAIDAQAVPDIHDPKWKGNRGYATSDVLVAPPNAKRVR